MADPKSSKSKVRATRDENWITVPGLFSIPSSRQKRNAPASLYVIGMIDQPEHVKIGIATNIDLRLTELQTANPFRLQLLASKDFPSKAEARRSERALHQRFQDVRASGEWFRLSPESRTDLIDSLSEAACGAHPHS